MFSSSSPLSPYHLWFTKARETSEPSELAYLHPACHSMHQIHPLNRNYGQRCLSLLHILHPPRQDNSFPIQAVWSPKKSPMMLLIPILKELCSCHNFYALVFFQTKQILVPSRNKNAISIDSTIEKFVIIRISAHMYLRARDNKTAFCYDP